MKGTTAECLSALVTECGLDEFDGIEAYKARAEIAMLLNVSQSSIDRWFTLKVFPKGENLLKLRVFLELAGFELNDWKIANEQTRKLCFLVATGVRSSAYVASYLNTNPDVVVGYLVRGDNMLDERAKLVAEIVSANSPAMQKARAEWLSCITGACQPRGSAAIERRSEAARVADKEHADDASARTGKDELIALAAAHIRALNQLADYLLSPACGPKDRERLRKLTETAKSNDVFELSNKLNALCGEKAKERQ